MCFTTDSTPDEQPQQIPEINERRENAAEEENGMEVNCNGNASTPERETHFEAQGTKQTTEEQEDRQNANQPESNTETQGSLSNKEEQQTGCSSNGSLGDTALLPFPASFSPDSVTVELKEGGEEEEKKKDKMNTQGETKRGDEEVDSQDG